MRRTLLAPAAAALVAVAAGCGSFTVGTLLERRTVADLRRLVRAGSSVCHDRRFPSGRIGYAVKATLTG